MFNSFLDGSKPAIESTAVSNATGLTPAPDGLAFPPCSVEAAPFVMRPASEGGQLHHKGQVEVAKNKTTGSAASAAATPLRRIALIGFDFAQYAGEVGTVGKVAIIKHEPWGAGRAGPERCGSAPWASKRLRPALDAVDLVALFDQEFGEIRIHPAPG